MKTRSNMPLFVVECEDVKALSNSQIDMLRCGDYLVKKDASGEHAYKVTFKSDTGICLTYHDAYCVETQSYDKVGDNWVYNSEDKTIIAEPSFENIVDKDGHKRFIEGEGTAIEKEGFTIKYNKWALSGSHLLLVLSITIENTKTITADVSLCDYVLPQWIIDKIYPIFLDRVAVQTLYIWGTDGSNQTIANVSLRKINNQLKVIPPISLTLTADRTFRIAFDLLIDNE